MPSTSRTKCYFGCDNDGPLHTFPKPNKDLNRFHLWKKVLGDKHKETDNKYIYNQVRFCNKHFENYFILNRRLTGNAVPTLCINVTSLHCFPNPVKDTERFRLWVLNIGGEIIGLDNNYIFKNRRVCHKHFPEKWHYAKNRLSALAVPTPNVVIKSVTATHRFPNPDKFAERFKDWVKFVGGKLETPSDYEYYRKKRMCDIHFRIEHKNRNNRLSTIAVPCYNLLENNHEPKPDEIKPKEKGSTGVKKVTTHDHQYSKGKPIIEKDPLADDVDPLGDDVDPLGDDVDPNNKDDFQDVTPEPQKEEVEVREVKENKEVKLTQNLYFRPGTREVYANKVVKLQEKLYAKPGEVNANKVQLPESLCAKPGIDDEELYLLDILDPDLLNESIEPQTDPEEPGCINEKLIDMLLKAWPPVLKGGLATEAKQKIFGRYPRPNNCWLLQTPTMNLEIAEMVPEKAVANDDKWCKMQQYVGTAITAISRAVESVLSGEDSFKKKTLQHLTNGGLLLCDLHYTFTNIRRISLTPFLDDTTKAVIKDMPYRDLTLFGPYFRKKWRTAKKLEPKKRKVRKKVRKVVKVVTCSEPSLVAYSGQWRAPLPLVRNRRAVGSRRPSSHATGPRRPPASHGQPPKRRRPHQPRPARSPGRGVKRENTEESQQIEIDAFGNIITSTPPDNEESHSHMQMDTEDRCEQGEVTDDVSRGRAVGMKKHSTGTIFKQIVRYDAWGHVIPSSVPPDIDKSQSPVDEFAEIQTEESHTQAEPAAVQLNQPRKTKLLKLIPVKRKRLGEGFRPLKKLSTQKLLLTEQQYASGNRITSIPTSQSPVDQFPEIQMEASHTQAEPVAVQLNQRRKTKLLKLFPVKRKSLGDGFKPLKKLRTHKLLLTEQQDASGNRITSIPTSQSPVDQFAEIQMEASHTQAEPTAVQLNQPRKTKLLKLFPVKRKRIGEGFRSLKKLSTQKLQLTEQQDAFGNRITSIPTSQPHTQTQDEGTSETQIIIVKPTIENYPNNRIIITRGSIPLVLPAQPSTDMPTLQPNDMPLLDSNDEPPDIAENTQVHDSSVENITEVDTEDGVSLLLQFRNA